MNPSSRRKRRNITTLRLERLEDRRVLAGSVFDHSIDLPVDSNGDDFRNVALQFVDQFHSRGAGLLSPDGTAPQTTFPDVDGKDGVTPFDALLVVNDLNRYGARLLGSHQTDGRSVDVNKDGWVTPFDALTVINTMNYQLRKPNSPAVATQTSEQGLSQNFDYLHSQFSNSIFQLLNDTYEHLGQTISQFSAHAIDADRDTNQDSDPLPAQNENENTEFIRKVYPVGDLVIPTLGRYGGFGGGGLGGGGGSNMGGGGNMGGAPIADFDALIDLIATTISPETWDGLGGGGGMDGDMGSGGAPIADFDALIDLITTTTAPETWDGLGGDATIQENAQNLSLVVNQTPSVHEQIVDLLDQLRRLQDLQVTIEVRFVTLNDNFFERIGVDFDFNSNDQTLPLPGEQDLTDGAPGVNDVGGFIRSFNRLAVPDLNFNENSFGMVPTFGGVDVDATANFGFAILSDIEVFFLLQASQGDDRSDVTQAPKVTLFNGQTAAIFSANQRPFVTSI